MTTLTLERGRGGALRWSARLMLLPAGAGLLGLSVLPALYVVALALSRSSLGQPLQAFVGLENLLVLVRDGDFLATLARTALFALPASAAQVAAGLAIALLLQGVRKGDLLRSVALLPLLTPPVLVGVAWKLLLAPAGGWVNGWLLRAGWIDGPVSWLGSDIWALPAVMLADTWQWLPFTTILCFGALQTLPQDVYEAAALDGARPVPVFLKITLPLLAPALLGIFLLRVVMALKTFDLVYVLTFGGPGQATTLASFEVWKTGLQNFDVGLAGAQTLLFSVFAGLATWPILKLSRWVERRLH
ncbi:Carbohydrate ABC transporter membrane protein 1 (CUT1 family) [Burkholderia multivorans]